MSSSCTHSRQCVRNQKTTWANNREIQDTNHLFPRLTRPNKAVVCLNSSSTLKSATKYYITVYYDRDYLIWWLATTTARCPEGCCSVSMFSEFRYAAILKSSLRLNEVRLSSGAETIRGYPLRVPYVLYMYNHGTMYMYRKSGRTLTRRHSVRLTVSTVVRRYSRLVQSVHKTTWVSTVQYCRNYFFLLTVYSTSSITPVYCTCSTVQYSM